MPKKAINTTKQYEELMKKYANVTHPLGVPKDHVELVRQVNTYRDDYICINWIFNLILQENQANPDADRKASVEKAVRSQKRFMSQNMEKLIEIKNILKRTPVEDVYKQTLRQMLKTATSKLNNTNAVTIPELIKDTSLERYAKQLESAGTTLFSDVYKNMPLVSTLEPKNWANETDPWVTQYLNKIHAACPENPKTRDEPTHSRTQARQKEKEERKYIRAKELLERKADMILNTYDQQRLRKVNNTILEKLRLRVQARSRHGLKSRIFLMAYVRSTQSIDTIYIRYSTSTRASGMTEHFHQASLFDETESVPGDIQKLINNHTVVCTERTLLP